MLNPELYLNLKPSDFQNTLIKEVEILKMFESLGASWVHSGDPKDPHAELTSGKCSNGFFDCGRVLKYFNLSEILAHQLARKIKKYLHNKKVDVVIGSPMAGITFAHDVGRALGARIYHFTEKDLTDSKKMIFKREKIGKGMLVLQIEELVTTSHTTIEVQEAINSAHDYPILWLPVIGMLVHRPPHMVEAYGGRKVIALVEKEVWAVDPSECPLCKQGSTRYRPKTHWAELTGKV